MRNMRKIVNVNDKKSKLEYIKENAPAIYERLLSQFDETEKEESAPKAEIRKGILLCRALIEAFEFSGVDAVMTDEIDGKLSLQKLLTKNTEVCIDGKYKIIDRRCFCFCPFIEKLEFCEGVEYIDEAVLYDSRTLREVIFPKTLLALSIKAFSNCTELDKVVLKNPHTDMHTNSFENTKWLNNFTDEFVVINGQLLKYNGNAENVILPEGVIVVGSTVFENNHTIKSLVCSSTLERISCDSFRNCINLEKVAFNEKLYLIAFGAFSGCQCLNEVILPRGVTHVTFDAFDKNTNIVVCSDNKEFRKHIKKNYPKHRFVD